MHIYPERQIDAVAELLERAEVQGHLTLVDVREALPEAEENLDEREEVFIYFHDVGIYIHENEREAMNATGNVKLENGQRGDEEDGSSVQQIASESTGSISASTRTSPVAEATPIAATEPGRIFPSSRACCRSALTDRTFSSGWVRQSSLKDARTSSSTTTKTSPLRFAARREIVLPDSSSPNNTLKRSSRLIRSTSSHPGSHHRGISMKRVSIPAISRHSSVRETTSQRTPVPAENPRHPAQCPWRCDSDFARPGGPRKVVSRGQDRRHHRISLIPIAPTPPTTQQGDALSQGRNSPGMALCGFAG